MEEKVFTLKEVIEDAVQTLNNTSVPVALLDSIGANLSRVSRNLQHCLLAMSEEEKKGVKDDGRKDKVK